jgi:hypothetical protein
LKVDKSFPLQSDGSNGLFSYFRSEHSNVNPHDSQIVNVAVSSLFFNDSTYRAPNVLDWGTSNYWYSCGNNLNWIDFALLGKPFIINAITLYTYSTNTPKKWALQGSYGDENFEDIYESNNDTQFNDNTKIITLSINCSTPYTRFRISAKDTNWNNNNYFGIYSIEFYGQLLSLN